MAFLSLNGKMVLTTITNSCKSRPISYPSSSFNLIRCFQPRQLTIKTATTVRTPQTLVLQSTGDRRQVVAVDSAESCRMFPRQSQLLQLTAQCLAIHTMASRSCKHKQQCCHSCLNFTRLCNIIKLRYLLTFYESLSIKIPRWKKNLLPDCVFGQLHALPTLKSYFPKMHLNVILSPLLQSFDCILKWVSTQMLCTFLVSTIWASPCFPTALGSYVSHSSSVSNIAHYRGSLVTSAAALTETESLITATVVL